MIEKRMENMRDVDIQPTYLRIKCMCLVVLIEMETAPTHFGHLISVKIFEGFILRRPFRFD